MYEGIKDDMKRVLFLCTGNSARSQMAEGWANHLGLSVAEFHSAGTWPSRNVNPYALVVMLERGIDIGAHQPKAFTSVPRPIDLVVAVCGQAAEQCPAPNGEFEVERWDLPDPAAATGTEKEILAVFRASRDEIERRIRDLLVRLPRSA